MAIQSASVQTLNVHFRYLRAKRLLDIVFVLLISVFIFLVSAFVAVLILFDSKGPILYRQKRIGQNGVEFEMLKFRSMYVDNNDAAHREAIKQYMNGETLNGESAVPFKLSNDPRITRVGRMIRKLSFDELPQFWNVLRGEMSLVGPRPPLPYEAELYTLQDRLRLSGKPGLTGTWQVYGRSKVSFQEMIEMDIAYLQHQSLWLDIKLIALTVPVMLLGRGAA
jgi:lipopolysaccharide/colanic/teichoic acid biosynthesis glycosyltransferase